MPRRVQHFEAEFADLEGVPIAEAYMVEGILPVGPSLLRQVELGSREGGQFAGTGEEVGMDMRFHDMGDLHPVLPGYLPVGVDIPLRVDDGGHPGLLAANEVRGLGQRAVVDMLEVHS